MSGQKKPPSNTFLTEVKFEKITEKDIVIASTRKRSHMDGITSIDVIPKYRAYATSSYDCCAYIWSLTENKRLGALYLGKKDPKWSFIIDEEKRKKEEFRFAKARLIELEEEKIQQEKDKNTLKRKFDSKTETIKNYREVTQKVSESPLKPNQVGTNEEALTKRQTTCKRV